MSRTTLPRQAGAALPHLPRPWFPPGMHLNKQAGRTCLGAGAALPEARALVSVLEEHFYGR